MLGPEAVRARGIPPEHGADSSSGLGFCGGVVRGRVGRGRRRAWAAVVGLGWFT